MDCKMDVVFLKVFKERKNSHLIMDLDFMDCKVDVDFLYVFK